MAYAKALGTAACLAAAAAAPSPGLAQEGERSYIERGCLGCHGASGRGGVGPPLADTPLAFEAFLHQIREPRQVMPAFPEAVVSDREARAIYDYLGALPPPPPRLRADLPKGGLDRATCGPCHQQLHPGIVRQFAASAMGLPGAQNPRVPWPQKEISCAECHGTDHDAIMASQGRVPEALCGACHPQIYQEHVLDAGHSYGPGPGDLGINWERNIGVPHYRQMPRKVMEMGCDPCHAQAGATDARYWSEEQKSYVDTSSLRMRNGCVSCHTRHAFSLAEARSPEACHTCHMGPDHPNFEAYISSKHGAVYQAHKASWDWNQPLAQATWDAPTCATCHMLEVAADGTRSTSHQMTRKIVWGMGVQPALGQLHDLTQTPENRAKRNEMVKVCLTCHSEDRARGYLESADAHKLAGDALVIEGRETLAALYRDGLIEPGHGRVSAGLLPGPRFSAVVLPDAVAQHSPASLYYDVTPIEREYFDLFFFSALKSYKGAFHMSPDYAWWYGYAEALGHLAAIRDEAQTLRSAKATRDRTLFMIWTGPLMVLAVLAAAFGIRRWLERRRRRPA